MSDMQKVYLMASFNGIAQCLLKLDDIEGVRERDAHIFVVDIATGTDVA